MSADFGLNVFTMQPFGKILPTWGGGGGYWTNEGMSAVLKNQEKF